MTTISPRTATGSDDPPSTDSRAPNLTTTFVNDTFKSLITEADKAIETFLTSKTNGEGTLDLSASDSLQLQKLMAEQSIAAQAATTTLKSVKDSIIAAARNI